MVAVEGFTVLLPVAETLPISGTIMIEVASLTLQFNVLEPPAVMVSGDALNDQIVGNPAG
jgi:hypothetical protein